MSLFKKALQRIEENRNKAYNCIPFDTKFPRLSEYFPGIQKGRYYLVSGASGAGKSQVTDDLFVFTALEFCEDKNISVKIFYYSLELDGETKMHQWISRKIFNEYGVRVNIDILNSVGKTRINDNIFMIVKETEEYFSTIEDRLIFREGIFTASDIISEVEGYAHSNGNIVTKEVEGKTVFDSYVPSKDEYVIIIVDHASLLSTNDSKDIKHAIEKLSKYFVLAKNRYGYSPVLIQQQSADGEDVEHFKVGKLEPSKSTLGESKLTYNDSDACIGIFQPQKHEIKNYRGYNIIDMGDNYRNLSIFKNRFGKSGVNVGLYFDGAVSCFKELPRKDEINSSHYEMIKKNKPNW